MKKIVVVAILIQLLFACQPQSGVFKIDGEIVPAKEGEIVLYNFDKGQPAPVDTTEVIDGKFTFEGEIGLPDLYMLKMVGERNYLSQLFVEASDINHIIYPDSFESNLVEGSSSNELYDTYFKEIVEFRKKQNDLRSRFSQAQMSGNTDEIDAIKLEYEAVADNLKLYSKNFIHKHNDSPVSAYIFLSVFFQEATLAELDSIIEVFDSSIRETKFVAAIKERADGMRSSAIGAIAPDFTLNDQEGNPISLSSFKGKYLLVDFWASWCQPCMMEMPTVKAAYEKYNEKGFEILGVSLDRQKEPWMNAISEKELVWNHVWDYEQGKEGEVATKYQVASIPFTLLLDKDGKIIAKNLRGDALENKLSELLD